MTDPIQWEHRRVELKDEEVNPYEGTKVTKFGGKPLSEYKTIIKEDRRYINKMAHYATTTKQNTTNGDNQVRATHYSWFARCVQYLGLD